MSKFARAVALVTVGLAAPLVVTAPVHAYAGTPGCVTLKEYGSITNGMSQKQVAARFGIASKPVVGNVTFTWNSTYSQEVDREYRICNSAGKPLSLNDGSVEVDFEKEAYDDGGFPPGPLLSTYKNRWS